MKKISPVLILILVGALLILPNPGAVKAEGGNLILPAKTIFPVEILDTLNSQVNKKGDDVRLEVKENVVANGIIVIPKGSRGLGNIDDVKRPGLFRAQGYLKISLGSFKTFNLVEVAVNINKSAQGAPSQTEKVLSSVIPTVSSTSSSTSGSGSSSWDPSSSSGSGSWSSSSSSFSFGLNPGSLIPGHEAQIDAGAIIYATTVKDVDLGITAEQALAQFGPQVCVNPPAQTPQNTAAPGQADTPAGVTLSSAAGPAVTANLSGSALTVSNLLVCRAISDTGDPIGVNYEFPGDIKALSVWFNFANLTDDTLLESKWFCNNELLRTKQIFLDNDKKTSSASGTIYDDTPFPKGDWRMELTLNGKILKSIGFKLQD